MKEKKPNFLLIGLDQMRGDTPGCNGNPVCRTPVIDRLAETGVNYSRAYAPCSLCAPSRASLWTGLYAFNHGMGTNCDLYQPLGTELETEQLLHQQLLSEGYRCGYVGKWHAGVKKGPCDHGFEGMNVPGYGNIAKEPAYLKYLADLGKPEIEIEHPIYANPNQKTLAAGCRKGNAEVTPPAFLAQETLSLLEKYAQSETPFFLTCQFWGPHMPHLPSEDFYGMHDRSKIEPWSNFHDTFKHKPNRLQREWRDFFRKLPESWEGWREIVGCYYDFCALIDAQIGRILEALDRLDLADNTVVALTSDHGDMTGSHGSLFDKGFIYEEAHRVPLIVRWPGKILPKRSEALVSPMDLMPAFLKLAGISFGEVDACLLPEFAENSQVRPRDQIYLEFHGLRSLYTQRALITSDGWKYIFTPGDFDEVYNLKEDPGEMNNLIDNPRHQEQVERLRKAIVQEAYAFKDPVGDYMNKLFGSWEGLSGQPDASSQWKTQN